MKKIIPFFLLILLSIALYIFFGNRQQGLIVENDHLVAILNYIDPIGTLVIFDIDNTLTHPTQELSSDEWFSYLVDKKVAEGFDYLTSVDYTLPKAFYAQFNIPLEPTEPHIPELIAYLIDENVAVMALTSRSIFIAERTVEQLDNININFFIPDINPDDLVLPMKDPSFYKQGILFGGNNDKGKTLNCFFKTMNYYPKKIIFVDDKMKNLLSVEKAMSARHIPFVGIRYSGSDARVKSFDPAKSEAQWRALKQKNSWLNKKLEQTA
ncbi:MAG TPA: DUF2608 domain-containing protein [Candidatus Babeliales bacterium]|jgi:hypothetical protein|nr:DUF2608 domain-containing protein [Candidatus Babeliales bacterium]